MDESKLRAQDLDIFIGRETHEPSGINEIKFVTTRSVTWVINNSTRRVFGTTKTNQCVHIKIKTSPSFSSRSISSQSHHHRLQVYTYPMAPKPASTAGKAPASTASKAPAKPTEGAKAAKKTSKAAAPTGDGEKKKRKKVRKETYSSYIYKG